MTNFIGREPLKIVAQIIAHELDMDPALIFDGNEKYDIPTTQGLFIVLTDMGPEPISRTSFFDTNTNSEEQTHTMLHPISIDVCSFNLDARQRKEEISLALDSIYAQQIMEQYQCQVASFTGKFSNVSAAEPSSYLKRYNATVNVTAIHGKVRSVSYFDKFNGATVDQTSNPPEVTQS